MNRSSNSHSSMFLMEMMIAILFFSLASAVCLRMFTKSRQMSEDTRNLNMAVSQIQNAAELLKHSCTPEGTDFPDLFFGAYPDADADAQIVTIYFDADWNHSSADEGAFCMKISQNAADEISAYEIQVLDAAETELSSLELKLHQPNRP